MKRYDAEIERVQREERISKITEERSRSTLCAILEEEKEDGIEDAPAPKSESESSRESGDGNTNIQPPFQTFQGLGNEEKIELSPFEDSSVSDSLTPIELFEGLEKEQESVSSTNNAPIQLEMKSLNTGKVPPISPTPSCARSRNQGIKRSHLKAHDRFSANEIEPELRPKATLMLHMNGQNDIDCNATTDWDAMIDVVGQSDAASSDLCQWEAYDVAPDILKRTIEVTNPLIAHQSIGEQSLSISRLISNEGLRREFISRTSRSLDIERVEATHQAMWRIKLVNEFRAQEVVALFPDVVEIMKSSAFPELVRGWEISHWRNAGERWKKKENSKGNWFTKCWKNGAFRSDKSRALPGEHDESHSNKR